MTNNKILLTAGAVALSTSIFSAATTAATVTATGNANVLAPLSIVQNTAMEFGDVAGDSVNPTTVVLTTAGGTSSADGAAVFTTGAVDAAGNFTVNGGGDVAYGILLPATITLGGAGTMTVSALTHDAGATPALVGGTDTFNVGGTLNIGAAQTVGAYTGTYVVEVNYQ